MDLQADDQVSLCDSKGAVHNYTVYRENRRRRPTTLEPQIIGLLTCEDHA